MSNDSFEQRFEVLHQEITFLKTQVNGLTERLEKYETTTKKLNGSIATSEPDEDTYVNIPDINSEKVWSWVGGSSLLPRIATVCFIMVFALTLRTLTDNNVIGLQVGSYLGMGYAALLIGWAVFLLGRSSKLAVVFEVCGILLMYSIALETHARFESVSSTFVYIILFFLLLTTSLVNIRFNHPGLNFLATFGTCLIASFIDFPKPYFTPLILLLLAGNILVYFSAKKLNKGEWNRLAIFAVSYTVWLLWTFRLRVPLEKGLTSDPYLAQAWYFPTMILFAAFFFFCTMKEALQGKQLSVFDLSLPTLNVLWALPLALVVVKSGSGSFFLLGLFGLVAALLHFGFSAYLFKKPQQDIKAICSFMIAGCILLILALPSATGSILLTIAILSGIALGVFTIAQSSKIGGIRLVSYLLQGLTGLLALATGSFATTSASPFLAMLVASIVGLISGYQYLAARKTPLSSNNGFFGAIDRHDRSAVVLLLVNLISLFCMLQLGATQLLPALSSDPLNTLKGVQSLFLNIGSIIILLVALSKRNKELMTIGVLVVIISAFKVFAYDLFKSHGVPLVLSVLSFGVVAAVGSVVMSKWSPSANKEKTV